MSEHLVLPGRERGSLCVVTGATGYIGGRLVRELLAAGYRVRCLSRDPSRLRDQPWADRVDSVRADLGDPASLRGALEGGDVVYYLVHSLGGGAGFEHAEATAARNLAEAAAGIGVRRIVYLGALLPAGAAPVDLSPHLRSRAKVGEILRAGSVPTAELRAAVVLGSGSASFEMLRYLTERLPVMVTPRWVRTPIQPIAVRDVLRYLVAAAELPAGINRSFDVGGPEVLTYREMMLRYARVAGLRRRVIVPFPVLTPGLSSHWVGLVTPVPRGLARPLVESLRHEVVCREQDIKQYVPDPPGGLLGFDDAVGLALARIRDTEVATRWSSAALAGAPSDPLPTDPGWAGGSLYEDIRQESVPASAAELWRVVEGIGGDHGWYSFPLAWALRGWLDRIVGGVGLRRGRRDPHRLRVGESLDFWRVEEIEAGRLLRLRAEMRLPGLAWLELRVEPDGPGRARYTQRATFHPRGLAGHAYWWSVAPFHSVVFGGMAHNIADEAARQAAARQAPEAAGASSRAPGRTPAHRNAQGRSGVSGRRGTGDGRAFGTEE